VLPALSSIVVTRPLSEAERAAHRWTEPCLLADTRTLLFYIRLLRDGRLLFGSRGGTDASPPAFAERKAWMAERLNEKFPRWAGVRLDYAWWGFVALAADRLPHLAPLADDPGVWWAGLYHGGGVAMGTWFGRAAAARLAGGREDPPLPDFVTTPPPRFPLAALRVWMLRAAYLRYGRSDERA
jgi:glycine/D-amino acid oxidase-like deaminating enzyme